MASFLCFSSSPSLINSSPSQIHSVQKQGYVPQRRSCHVTAKGRTLEGLKLQTRPQNPPLPSSPRGPEPHFQLCNLRHEGPSLSLTSNYWVLIIWGFIKMGSFAAPESCRKWAGDGRHCGSGRPRLHCSWSSHTHQVTWSQGAYYSALSLYLS